MLLNRNFFISCLGIFVSLVAHLLFAATQPTSPIKLDEYSTSVEKLREAKCRYKILKTDREISNYFIVKTAFLNQKNIEYNGFRFKNDNDIYFSILRNLIEPDTSYRPESEPTSYKSLKQNCDSSICVIKNLFGEKNYWRVMYLSYEYGLNTSHLRFGDSYAPSDILLNAIFNTLEYIPPHLRKIGTQKRLIHAIYDPKSNLPSEAANANIAIQDRFFQFPESFRPYLLFHEFAHNWSFNTQFELDESDEWLKISGWKKIPMMFTYAWEHHLQFNKNPQLDYWISHYSRANSWEDFAESVSAYRFNPEKLLKLSPAKYNYIKRNIFFNIEFQDEKNCYLDEVSLNTQNRYALKNVLDSKLSYFNSKIQQPEQYILKDLVFNNCFNETENVISQNSKSYDSFKQCFSRLVMPELKQSSISPNINKMTGQSLIDLKEAEKNYFTDRIEKLMQVNESQPLQWAQTSQANCLSQASVMTQYLWMSRTHTADSASYNNEDLNRLTHKISLALCLKAKTYNSNKFKLDRSLIEDFVADILIKSK